MSSNNDGHDFRLGLGSMSSTTYFTAMSNTAEKENTSRQFVNEPYAGIYFNSDDLDIPVTGWTTKLLTVSIPHHNQLWDSIAHDIWIKRVQIGGAWNGSVEPEQMNLYKRTQVEISLRLVSANPSAPGRCQSYCKVRVDTIHRVPSGPRRFYEFNVQL